MVFKKLESKIGNPSFRLQSSSPANIIDQKQSALRFWFAKIPAAHLAWNRPPTPVNSRRRSPWADDSPLEPTTLVSTSDSRVQPLIHDFGGIDFISDSWFMLHDSICVFRTAILQIGLMKSISSKTFDILNQFHGNRFWNRFQHRESMYEFVTRCVIMLLCAGLYANG